MPNEFLIFFYKPTLWTEHKHKHNSNRMVEMKRRRNEYQMESYVPHYKNIIVIASQMTVRCPKEIGAKKNDED